MKVTIVLDGKVIVERAKKMNDGTPIVLRFVSRSDHDIQKSRIQAYPLLLP